VELEILVRDSKNMGEKLIILTGGAGYIGSTLVRHLLQNNFKVVCIDNLRYGGRSLIGVWGNPNFQLEQLDITNFDDLDQAIDRYDFFALIHLAAIVGDPACNLEPELAIKTNRDASIHILEKITQRKNKRFIFASTCSNYGKMENLNGFVDENSPLSPISLYAELKVEFEKLILSEKSNSDFTPTILRFATVYGTSPRMRFDLTVNEFTKELALERELEVYGDQFWRPYCHVRDYSQAVLKVLSAPKSKIAGEVFNVGDTSQNFTKKMLVTEILKQIPEGKVKYVHKDEDPRDYRVSFDKINNTLGFKATKTVPDGIREIYTSLKFKIIEDPNNKQYYNTPR
jgi:nucleoside-diphosphate-sugar epimerase